MSRKRRKLSQAQKDLKKALKINYRRATTSTSQSNVTCKSCGKPGHSRRSSKLCDDYRPRTKALAKEAWECKPELFTIKDSLSKSCRSEIAISNIQKIIPIVRDITFDAANLSNRHFLRLLTTGQSISEEYFDKSNWFFLACLKMVSGEIPYVPEHSTLYHTNIINHLADHFDDRLGRYIFFHLWELRHNIQIDDQQVDHESVQYEEEDDKASKKDPVKWEKMENGHVWKLTNYIKRKPCSQEALFPLFVKTMAIQDRRKTIQLVNEILKRPGSPAPARSNAYTADSRCSRPGVVANREIQKEMPNNPQLLSLELLVYSKPHEFYNFFFKILVFFEGRRYSREPTPKQAATKGYVHRKIMKIFGTDNISTNFKNKLEFQDQRAY
ncbi:hypothetical protein BGW37DRAFT_560680 [Umbelopsis sp. PMI_123]|nr:hypothetical protein BGW37DRAFT_560680 [Umbelopsis sp. PMI_123]